MSIGPWCETGAWCRRAPGTIIPPFTASCSTACVAAEAASGGVCAASFAIAHASPEPDATVATRGEDQFSPVSGQSRLLIQARTVHAREIRDRREATRLVTARRDPQVHAADSARPLR